MLYRPELAQDANRRTSATMDVILMLGIQRCRSSAAKATAIEAVRLLHEQLLSNWWLKLEQCSLLAAMHAACSLSNR
jgi:hypothetical protein